MKMKATIEIDFEATDGQPENILESALARGVVALATAIDCGRFSGTPTGIKNGSVTTFIRNKEMTH